MTIFIPLSSVCCCVSKWNNIQRESLKTLLVYLIQVVKDEKSTFQPPRLGRQKFEPPSVQVATTDELGGSLRRVRPCPMVTLDRFKSLQQRGLIEPRKPVAAKAGRRIEYEKGGRAEKALAGQAEIDGLKRERKKAARKAILAEKEG